MQNSHGSRIVDLHIEPISNDWLKTREPSLLASLGDLPGIERLVTRDNETFEARFHRSLLPCLPFSKSDRCYPSRASGEHAGTFFDSCPFRLRPYQREAVDFVRERAGSLLFHDLGMGKTAMALAALEAPALIVAPSTALYGWHTAATDFGAKVNTLRGSCRGKLDTLKKGHDIYLTTYHSAGQWIPWFRKLGTGPRLHTLIADECHMLHRSNLRWVNAWNAITCQRRIGMTATPLRNRMPSLWGCLNAVTPRAWGPKHEFLERYAGATDGPYGRVLGELTNSEELVARLNEVSLRRSLEEPEFIKLRPPHTRTTISISLPTARRRKMFADARKKIGNFSLLKTSASHLEYISTQRIAAGREKLRWLFENERAVQNELEKNVRTLWWFWFEEHARNFRDWLTETFEPLAVDHIAGSTTPKRRTTVLREWAHGDITAPRALIGTIGALNAAANLLTCRAAYFVELDWQPIMMVQAEKRHHRPGNKFPNVETSYLVLEDTIDDDIADNLFTKVSESERIFSNSGAVEQISALFKNPLTEEGTK